MISIIICSRKSVIPEELEFNISSTIGVSYECIIIDNSQNNHTIFSAYNEGVRRAKYHYLCFMHEDILFHTVNWGKRVVEHFENKKVGLIGVIGSHYMPNCPASWWSTECRSGQIIQGQIENNNYSTNLFEWNRNNTDKSESIEVVTVDGLWFCMPKEIFDNISFDEITYSGFHCYDTDICFQTQNIGYLVKVVFDILIEHKSYGNQDQRFFDERIKCFEKWSELLPVIKGITLSDVEIYDREQFVIEINKELSRRLKVENELYKVRLSRAYRIGKKIVKIF